MKVIYTSFCTFTPQKISEIRFSSFGHHGDEVFIECSFLQVFEIKFASTMLAVQTIPCEALSPLAIIKDWFFRLYNIVFVDLFIKNYITIVIGWSIRRNITFSS
uniref:Uncharacterized protein n=1 Tax=Cacopsylla melanoneura TaxID=428564 RepID=A0A8D9B107_9HEMI